MGVALLAAGQRRHVGVAPMTAVAVTSGAENKLQLFPMGVDAQEDLGAALLGEIGDEEVELSPNVGGDLVADKVEILSANLLHFFDGVEQFVELLDILFRLLVALPNSGNEKTNLKFLHIIFSFL